MTDTDDLSAVGYTDINDTALGICKSNDFFLTAGVYSAFNSTDSLACSFINPPLFCQHPNIFDHDLPRYCR